MKNVMRFALGILVLAIVVVAVAVFSESRKTRAEMRELRIRVTRLEEMVVNPHARFWLINRDEKIK